MISKSDTYFHYPSAHGVFTVGASVKGITRVAFAKEDLAGSFEPTALTNRAATQLQEYLAGKRKEFDVPLDPQGSAFQRSVWTEAAAIPYDQTRTPADIATALGKPGSYRSVGTAIRQNELAPFIPTHRIEQANATGPTAKIFAALRKLESKNTQE